MQIVTNLQNYKARPSRPLVLAVGNFDGFHLGHQKLLRFVLDQARRRKLLSAVLTFPEHPHSILHPDRKPMMLMSVEQKLFYLAQSGIDLCFLPSFTTAFSRMTPSDFVNRILVEKLRVQEVCMGYDSHFGCGRKGNTALMKRLAAIHGFSFRKMRPVMSGGELVSSTRVRQLLIKGEIEKTAKCLGRPFSVFGRVVPGKGHGRHLGFPTANLEVHSEILLPLGVYIASGRFLKMQKDRRVLFAMPRLVGPWHPGIMNFGNRPTYPKAETPRSVVELHLLDFNGRVYGKTMEMALHRFVRREQKFACENTLKEKIRSDIQTARKYYASRKSGQGAGR